MKKLIYFLLIISGIYLTGCKNVSGNDTAIPLEPNDGYGVIINKVLDYGGGVYYFGYTGDDFAKSLAGFIQAHKELQMISMASDGSNGYGKTEGYFVVFKKTK